jgi:glycosyltransferase involved in cell wall biosynthesis
MKLSIFTTITNPTVRGDNWKDAIQCYRELADEVIIVSGGENPGITKLDTVKIKYNEWPQEFNWPFIGEQFQRGYEAATGDWVIHADIDFLFHENDFTQIREAMIDHPDAPALSFWKHQFILPDRYNLKSRLVIAVNKGRYGDRIKFNSGGDLCQPSLDGEEIKPDYVEEARVPLWNYEKILKNSNQVTDDCGRMARAWFRHFGEPKLGFDNEGAFDEWVLMMKGRFAKDQQHIKLSAHPKYIQRTIENLQPDQFGYNGFGLFGDNDYMKELVHA